MLMGTPGRVLLLRRATGQSIVHTDSLDHEDALLHFDVAFGLGRQMTLARGDPARFQRASQGAGESTSGGSDDVVEGGGMRFEGAGRCPVMLRNFIVDAE